MPRFTLIMWLPDAPRHPVAAIESLLDQTFSDWELLVTGGPLPLERAGDPRIRLISDGHDRVTATNAALSRARGDFVALLDHTDELAPAALARLGEVIGDSPQVDLVYTDEDLAEPRARRSSPLYKPDWSPDRLLCQSYIGRLAVMRTSVVHALGGLRAGIDGADEWDLLLRLGERSPEVAHVPELLCRRGLSSAAPESGNRHAPAAGVRVVTEHLERTAFPATVELDERGWYRLRPRLHDFPLVSIIIPTGGRQRIVYGAPMTLVVNCVESIVKRSTYDNYEIVCVIDDATEERVRTALIDIAGERLRLVRFSEPFNFAGKINRGAVCARGDHLLVLNDDTQVIGPDWIESLLMFSQAQAIGAVGAKLRFADGRIQHAGIISLGRGGPGHPYYGFPRDARGYADNLVVPTNYLAVTAACLMTARACFEEVGGFSTTFPLNYNDVDFCLKLHHRGYRVVLNPEVELFHFEGSSRASQRPEETEIETLVERWGRTLERDPYYNPNFLPSCDFRPPIRISEDPVTPTRNSRSWRPITAPIRRLARATRLRAR